MAAKSYVRNHGEIITKSLSKLCQESLENHVLNWDDCFKKIRCPGLATGLNHKCPLFPDIK